MSYLEDNFDEFVTGQEYEQGKVKKLKKVTKFTFKTNKPTGKWAWVHNPSHYIKYGKVQVGSIDHETNKIRLQVIKDDINEGGNPNCPWKWITLAYKPTSLQDAKDFLNLKFDILIAKYKLYTDQSNRK